MVRNNSWMDICRNMKAIPDFMNNIEELPQAEEREKLDSEDSNTSSANLNVIILDPKFK